MDPGERPHLHPRGAAISSTLPRASSLCPRSPLALATTPAARRRDGDQLPQLAGLPKTQHYPRRPSHQALTAEEVPRPSPTKDQPQAGTKPGLHRPQPGISCSPLPAGCYCGAEANRHPPYSRPPPPRRALPGWAAPGPNKGGRRRGRRHGNAAANSSCRPD